MRLSNSELVQEGRNCCFKPRTMLAPAMTVPRWGPCAELLVPAHPQPLPAESFTFAFRGKKIADIIKPHKLCCKRETVSGNWTTAQVSCTSRDSKSRDVNPWLSKAWQGAEIISCLKIKQRYMVRSSANLTDVVVPKSIYLYQPRSCPLFISTNKDFFSWWTLSVCHSAAFPLVQF